MARRIEELVPKGRVLDVGCGSGVFIATMERRGWKVAGLEPNLALVRQLRTHYGFDVRAGTLEAVPEDWSSFDAVALLDVIEHVPNPLEALSNVRRVLRPGGVVLLSTPNVESVEHRLFQRYWFGLQPPVHLSLFSPDSLRRLATMSGFAEVRLVNSAVSYLWPSLRRRFSIPPFPGSADTAMKALGALTMGAIGMALRSPAQLELYARRLD